MKKAARNKLAKTRVAPKKKLAQKKIRPKKPAVKTNSVGKKIMGGKTGGIFKRQVQSKSRSVDTVAVSPEGQGARAAVEQPGDLQGLSHVASADSESVDELLEEGNTFEAEVVKGVEDAEDADEEEVRTHEVPENDVPSEYLEKE